MPSIADILIAQGREIADYRRRQGERRAAVVAGLGQMPGQIMADRQAQQVAQRRAAIEAEELQMRRNTDARATAATELAINADARAQSTHDQARLDEQRGREAVLGWMKQHAASLQPDEAAKMEAILQMPGGTKHLVDHLLKAPAPYTLNPGDQRRDGNNNIVAENPRPPEKPPVVTFGQPQPLRIGGRIVMTRAGSDGQIYDMKGQVIQGAETAQPYVEPSTAQPSYQAREVLGDDGKPIMATFNSRTRAWQAPDGSVIQTPRPVPSAMETQDARKFKQAEPILRSVSELSERINTQQGVYATMAGGVAKQKAKVNLDDDVAEYEALISGFTPLVARALGHTGVLTQQDVDSVKALFPRPGDSKVLRDRKIARIKTIVGELETGAGGIETPLPAAGAKADSKETPEQRMKRLYDEASR